MIQPQHHAVERSPYPRTLLWTWCQARRRSVPQQSRGSAPQQRQHTQTRTKTLCWRTGVLLQLLHWCQALVCVSSEGSQAAPAHACCCVDAPPSLSFAPLCPRASPPPARKKPRQPRKAKEPVEKRVNEFGATVRYSAQPSQAVYQRIQRALPSGCTHTWTRGVLVLSQQWCRKQRPKKPPRAVLRGATYTTQHTPTNALSTHTYLNMQTTPICRQRPPHVPDQHEGAGASRSSGWQGAGV